MWTSSLLIEQIPTDGVNVEASRHRGPRGLHMDSPFQLKMILASANLQKMSGQDVWTHPPMVLLAMAQRISLLPDQKFSIVPKYLAFLRSNSSQEKLEKESLRFL